jgi:hypothetical protein
LFGTAYVKIDFGEVVELVYTTDLKSVGHVAHAGSSPAFATKPEKREMIPKTIFQTGKNKQDEYIENTILSFCNIPRPDWEYKYFTDSECIDFFNDNPLEEFPDIVNKFKSFTKGEHFSQLFRYYYLYVRGGIFIDLDAMFETSVDSIVKEYDFISANSFMHLEGKSDFPYIFDGFMASQPRHPVVYEVLKFAYSTDNSSLLNHYHLFCEEIHRIITDIAPQNIKIYQEVDKSDEGYGGSVIVDEEGEVVLSHYWRSKVPPRRSYWNNYNKSELHTFPYTILNTYQVPNALIRVGPKKDGGYIIVDGLKYDMLLSCGIGREIGFEEEFLDAHNIDCIALDGTIEKYPNSRHSVKWINKNVGALNTRKKTNLKEYAKGKNNIFLKMDIEGCEFDWLESTTPEELRKFSQIVIEVHWPFDKYRWNNLNKLNETHYLVHIHGNNYCDDNLGFKMGRPDGGYITINNPDLTKARLPDVFEATFVRKDLVNHVEQINFSFPTDLDAPNNPNAEDLSFKIPDDSATSGSGRSNWNPFRTRTQLMEETHSGFTAWKVKAYNRGKKTPSLTCTPTANTEIHSLICSTRVQEYLISIKSFLYFFTDVAVVVHDDGSLSEDDKNLIVSHISGVKIISKESADDAVDALLENKPFCKKYRNNFVNAKQLLDFALLSEGEKIISLDSDTLFLNKPIELIDWINDSKDVVKYSHETKADEQNRVRLSLGYEEESYVNIGFSAYPKGVLDLELTETLLSKLQDSDWYTGQDIFSILVSESPYSYECFNKENYQNIYSFKDDGVEFRHYFSSTWVFGFGSRLHEDTTRVLEKLESQTMKIKSRNELPELLNNLKLFGEGVEIGVQEGLYSYEILSRSKLKTLYSIDPWSTYTGRVYNDVGDTSQEIHDYRYLKTIMKLMQFGTRSVCIRQASCEAVKLFKDESLDFIYIDANHSYEAVKEDLERWFPKIKPGGIFAGHDYLNGEVPYGTEWGSTGITDFGVKQAVDEFTEKGGFTLRVAGGKNAVNDNWEKAFPTWYIYR